MSKARDIANLLTDGKVEADDLNVGQLGGRRNLIINGAMQVAQRGTSDNIVNAERYLVDRWRACSYSANSDLTFSHSTDAPAGFSYSSKITKNTADANPAFVSLRYRPEDKDVAHWKIGTADAETVTFSFWVKSSVAGIYVLNLLSDNTTRSYAHEYTINNPDTWEHKTATIQLDTTGDWSTSNGNIMYIDWTVGAQSLHRTSSPSTWNTGGVYLSTTTAQNSWATSAGNTFQLTGVQLELGSVATPFEHRSYGEELALCQRYFQRLNTQRVGTGYFIDDTRSNVLVYLRTTMRALPTVTATALGHTLREYISWYPVSTFGLNDNGTDVISLTLTHSNAGVGTHNYQGTVLGNNADYSFDAEL